MSREPFVSDDRAVAALPGYDVERLQADLARLSAVQAKVMEGPYQDGLWTGIPLCAPGGLSDDIRAGSACLPFAFTAHIEATPYFKEVLLGLGAHLHSVRVLALQPGGVIGEHCDFGRGFQTGLIRLHIPVVTNPGAKMVIDRREYYFEAGMLWYADFSKLHSVRNDSPFARTHILADVGVTPELFARFPEALRAFHQAKGLTFAWSPSGRRGADLERFAIRFVLPRKLRPLFQPGAPLRALRKDLACSLVVVDDRLVARAEEGDLFALQHIESGPSGEEFGLVGSMPSIRFIFRGAPAPRSLDLDLVGLPDDLFAAGIGSAEGYTIVDHRVEPLMILEESLA